MGNKIVKARIGMRTSYAAPIIAEPLNAHPTYGAVLDMGAAVKGYTTVETASLDLYGDDENLVHDEKFVRGALDAETARDDLELNAALYGHAYDAGAETSNKDDSSPFVGYGYIEPILLKTKQVIYRATMLYKLSANASSEKNEADTKKADLDAKMNAIAYTIYADNTGDWRKRLEFSTEAEAEAWILTQFGSRSVYVVKTAIHGAGSVDKPAVAVESGSVTLTFSSAPDILIDNGTDVTSSLSNKSYTIASVSADHDIVAVFA